ncbi:hypothetical protein ALP22_01657 [Pseudomonas coronafaciens pv. porri]|nr:Uncharacterized protein ALO89_03384 [Pseudomonas coronafaciens pv. porri]RMU83733.1 hypothetical protein ALP22_01657 [Pseudomonas coronafaciens pv. porri]
MTPPQASFLSFCLAAPLVNPSSMSVGYQALPLLETRMFIGILLILTWLILLLRYPAKALQVSLAAAAGLGIVAAIVIWQDSREARQLEHLEMRLSYDPQGCPADRPLQVSITNTNQVALQELRWRIAAYAPGDSVNLADNTYTTARYRGPGELQAKGAWKDCVPLPVLRSGYRPQTLEFRAEHLQGSFSD